MKKKLTTNRLNAILMLIAFAFILNSCTQKELTRDEIVKNNIDKFIKLNSKDPDSYEFVSLTFLDSVLYIDNINFRKEMFLDRVKNDEGSLGIMISGNEEFPSTFSDYKMNEYRRKIENNMAIYNKIEEVEKSMGEKVNDVASYTYIFKMRGSAKVLNEYFVQTEPQPTYKILNITDDRDKLFLAPNGFPDWEKIVLSSKY